MIAVQNEEHICRGNWKALFYVIAFTVGISLLIKCPLFITRQIVPPLLLLKLCPENNASIPGIEQQYIFTMVVYNSIFIGRFVESKILLVHVYNFFNGTASEVNKFKDLCIKGLKTRNKWTTVSLVILSIYMLVHSLSVPALGITLEIKSGKGSNCKPYVYEYHTVYWILDVIRYLYDVVVRLFMVLATLAVGVIWSEENEIACDNASENVGASQQEPTTYMQYLEDREIANEDHSTRSQEYIERGKRVECILEIFRMWFILPWLLYFISSSLDTDYILRTWREGPSGDDQYNFSKVAYLVYSFNQLFLLTLPYLCSRKMNIDHRNYISNSRKQQLKLHKTASRRAIASLNRIEEEPQFNFVPHIVGTSIKIQVENPLYTVFLLVGFFFTVVDALI